MDDELEYVPLFKYKLNKNIIDKCIEENRDITSQDVKIVLHQILEDNKIKYKNKLVENWSSVSNHGVSKYSLFVELYVLKKDKEKAEELLNQLGFTNNTDV